jgi:hypothetical protein
MVPVVPMLETKWVIFPLGVAPDFRSRRFVVDHRVVRVGELVEHDAFAVGDHFLGQVARGFHAAFLRREDDLGAEGAHGLAALGRQVLWHQQQQAVAADRRRHGERDAGVAGGGLDQRVAGLDPAALLGMPDHRHGRAVLDRPRGVIALELRQNDVFVFFRFNTQSLNAHQRGVADEIFDGPVHVFDSAATYAATPCSTLMKSPGNPAARRRDKSAWVKLWYLPTSCSGNGI